MSGLIHRLQGIFHRSEHQAPQPPGDQRARTLPLEAPAPARPFLAAAEASPQSSQTVNAQRRVQEATLARLPAESSATRTVAASLVHHAPQSHPIVPLVAQSALAASASSLTRVFPAELSHLPSLCSDPLFMSDPRTIQLEVILMHYPNPPSCKILSSF